MRRNNQKRLTSETCRNKRDEDKISHIAATPTRSTSSLHRQQPMAYKREPMKTIMAVCLCLFTFCLNALVQCVIHDIVGRHALPDLTFALVPAQPWAQPVADKLVLLSALTTTIFAWLHRRRWIVVRRVALMSAFIFLLRAMCVAATQLPPAYVNAVEHCQPPANHTTALLYLGRFWKVIVQTGMDNTFNDRIMCGDLMFSGHTAVFAMCCFVLNYYTPVSLWPIRFILIIICIVGASFMVISRAHYTVDVVVSYWLTTGMFTLYHGICDISLKERPKSIYRRIGLFWLVYEFEMNVPHGRLSNQMEWPLKWPRCLDDFLLHYTADEPPDTSAGRLSKSLSEIRIQTKL